MQTRRRALRRIPNARPQAQPPRRIVGAWIHSLPGPVFPERKPTPVGCRHAPSGFAGQKKEWAQPIRTRTPTWCGRPGCQFSIRDPLHRAAPVPGIRTLRRRMRCGQRFDLTLVTRADGWWARGLIGRAGAVDGAPRLFSWVPGAFRVLYGPQDRSESTISGLRGVRVG